MSVSFLVVSVTMQPSDFIVDKIAEIHSSIFSFQGSRQQGLIMGKKIGLSIQKHKKMKVCLKYFLHTLMYTGYVKKKKKRRRKKKEMREEGGRTNSPSSPKVILFFKRI